MVGLGNQAGSLRCPAVTLRGLALAAGLVLAAAARAADGRNHCDVALEVGVLPEATTLGLVDLTVQYARPKIFPLDPTGSVRCSGLLAGSAVAATNKFNSSSTGTLTIAFASAQGAPASTAVLRCEVHSAGTSVPAAEDFPVITTLQARSPAGAPIDPLPAISLGQVRCGSAVVTTTTSTTTQPPATTTTTTLEPESCSVGFDLATTGDFRRVRLAVDYSDAGGHPVAPAASTCRAAAGIGVGAVLEAASRTLTLEVVSVAALHGPRQLVACDFVPTAFLADASAFAVNVLAAADSSGAPLAQLPAVTASDVRCPSQTTTTTTMSATTTIAATPCGDADNDGTVEAGDALLALRRAVGLPSFCPLVRCDVDSNGSVKASDALLILRKAVGAGGELNCPL